MNDLANTSAGNHNLSADDFGNSLSKLSFVRQISFEPTADQNRTKPLIEFEIEDHFYIENLINDLKSKDLNKNFGKNTLLSSGAEEPETIIVEFSSPNIAKPFHVGNYRSTIVGNFVANFLQFCGHNVIRLNYLGDFGTQFGILSLAFDYFGDDKSLATDPIKHLYDVYVKGNAECKSSEEWRQSAKSRFNDLETKENSDVLRQWQRFRELSVSQLKALYRRLGIQFDDFHSESMYSKASLKAIEELRQLGLIETDESGAQIAVINGTNSRRIPVIKSDGSTLYLTRDIAAALHRKQLYNFSKMFYVVDSTQSKHFNHLFHILHQLDSDFCHTNRLNHLKFGRIIGMNTRKGETIFLEDVLNEAKERAIESCKASPNTKISMNNLDNFETVADILGMSGLLIHDLSHRRVTDYKFNWERALRHTGDTGISIQYTHARLCSLESNCGFDIDYNFEPNINALNEFESKLLINLLSQFDEVLNQSLETLDPSLIVHYLFDLRNAINRGLQVMKVKGQEPDLAKTRLLLFFCSRNVLNHGMKLLGLKPLNSM